LIANVSSVCNNTVVVIHSVGAVLLDEYEANPNVTAILWAGLPGEQSGNSIADVLYGRVNPGAKLPFTIAKARKDYGTDVLYEQNADVPQLDLTEGVFIDYRALDRAGTEPLYEFGYGLSYTTFSYSNINIETHPVGSYAPTTGMTSAAPTFGTIGNDTADYLFPPGFAQVPLYIYPYLNSTDLPTSANDPSYGVPGYVPPGAQDGSPQPKLAAGGAPGGNPMLYDVMYTVTATVTNTGGVGGEEVPQLYVALGGPYDPSLVLRGFERLSIQPGASAIFRADVTRRDLSNWDPVAQDWAISGHAKTAHVGGSSRQLPLSMAFP
jgi:beta-glucosidase